MADFEAFMASVVVSCRETDKVVSICNGVRLHGIHGIFWILIRKDIFSTAAVGVFVMRDGIDIIFWHFILDIRKINVIRNLVLFHYIRLISLSLLVRGILNVGLLVRKITVRHSILTDIWRKDSVLADIVYFDRKVGNFPYLTYVEAVHVLLLKVFHVKKTAKEDVLCLVDIRRTMWSIL